MYLEGRFVVFSPPEGYLLREREGKAGMKIEKRGCLGMNKSLMTKKRIAWQRAGEIAR
jgi:hypothetical protein